MKTSKRIGLNPDQYCPSYSTTCRVLYSMVLHNPAACHLHLLNKWIASSHSAALACLDNCRFNRLRGASARAARDALPTIRPNRHGVQSVGQQQTTSKVLQPCLIKLSWSPKYKDSQGYNQHGFNLKSELLYMGVVWTFAFCMILRSSVKWQSCKDLTRRNHSLLWDYLQPKAPANLSWGRSNLSNTSY